MGIIGGWKLKYKMPAKKRKSSAKKFKAYRQRNTRLSVLGYDGYAEYLNSDDWKKIREEKLRLFPNCLLCRKPAEQVHHLDYSHEVLLGLVPQLLVTLCDACHGGIEFTPAKEKRTLIEANSHLRELAQAAGMHRWLVSVKRAHEALRRKRRKTRRVKADQHKKAVQKYKDEKKARKAAKQAANPPAPQGE